jgi:hypothetical protein
MHNWNPSIPEAQTGGLRVWGQSGLHRVLGQLELHSELLPQEKRNSDGSANMDMPCQRDAIKCFLQMKRWKFST